MSELLPIKSDIVRVARGIHLASPTYAHDGGVITQTNSPIGGLDFGKFFDEEGNF